MSGWPCFTFHAITASRTTPTLCVFVIITGPSRKPESSTHVVPVISPLPFSVNHAAKTAPLDPFPRGSTAVTPVRTGPSPTFRGPSHEIRVVCPTSTHFYIRDRIKGTRDAVKWNSQITGARLGLRRNEDCKKQNGNPCSKMKFQHQSPPE